MAVAVFTALIESASVTADDCSSFELQPNLLDHIVLFVWHSRGRERENFRLSSGDSSAWSSSDDLWLY